MNTRARALTRPQRRAQLVEVTSALLYSLREEPSTRMIAEAAEIAEGTIFRAFDSKQELLDAVVDRAMCPAALLARFDDIDLGDPLEEKLARIAAVLQQRFSAVMTMLQAIGVAGQPPHHHPHDACRAAGHHVVDVAVEAAPGGGSVDAATAATVDGPGADTGHGAAHAPDADTDHQRAHELLNEAIAALVEPNRGELRVPVPKVVTTLRALVFAGTNPHLVQGPPLSPEVLVDLLLHGVGAAADISQPPADPAPPATDAPSPQASQC